MTFSPIKPGPMVPPPEDSTGRNQVSWCLRWNMAAISTCLRCQEGVNNIEEKGLPDCVTLGRTGNKHVLRTGGYTCSPSYAQQAEDAEEGL